MSELERGWVTGQGADQDLQVEQIKAESTVQAGDIVSTSGVQESLAPADLPVGRVTSVARHAGTGLLEVHVAPSANLANLNFVKVLLYCTECAPALIDARPSPPARGSASRSSRSSPSRSSCRCSPTCGRSTPSPTSCCCSCWPSGMVAGPRDGALCGFFIGFVYDLMLRTPFGLSALAYALIGYAAGYLQARGLVGAVVDRHADHGRRQRGGGRRLRRRSARCSGCATPSTSTS